jgi:hypothetical protein
MGPSSFPAVGLLLLAIIVELAEPPSYPETEFRTPL